MKKTLLVENNKIVEKSSFPKELGLFSTHTPMSTTSHARPNAMAGVLKTDSDLRTLETSFKWELDKHGWI